MLIFFNLAGRQQLCINIWNLYRAYFWRSISAYYRTSCFTSINNQLFFRNVLQVITSRDDMKVLTTVKVIIFDDPS